MKLFLVRHGETEKIDKENVLTLNGISQAKEVAKTLINFNVDKIFSSDLIRAKDTCKEYVKLSPSINVMEDPRLREVYRVLVGGPEREGTSEDRLANDKKRADEIFEEFLSKGEDVIIFAHGNIIRYFISKALNLETKNLWTELEISHCSISILKKEGDRFELETINLNDSPTKESIYVEGN